MVRRLRIGYASPNTTLTAAQGAYGLTGQTVALYPTRIVTAARGTLSLSGQDATLVYVAIGTAPQWVDTSGNALAGAVLPGFPSNLYAVSDTAPINFGTTASSTGSPTSYSYQFQRNGGTGDQTGMSSGSGVTTLSYTFVTADRDQAVTITFTPVNSSGSGRSYTCPAPICT